MGLKSTFTEVGIQKKDFAHMAQKACEGDVLQSGLGPLKQEDIEKIF